MKNANWKNIALIAGIAVAVVIFWPKVKVYAQKIPLIGSFIP